MDTRTRSVLAVVWLLVALLALATIDSFDATFTTGARLFAAGLAIWLAAVYALNPKDVLDRFHQ